LQGRCLTIRGAGAKITALVINPQQLGQYISLQLLDTEGRDINKNFETSLLKANIYKEVIFEFQPIQDPFGTDNRESRDVSHETSRSLSKGKFVRLDMDGLDKLTLENELTWDDDFDPFGSMEEHVKIKTEATGPFGTLAMNEPGEPGNESAIGSAKRPIEINLD